MHHLDVYWATPLVFSPQSEPIIAAEKQRLQAWAHEQGVALQLLSPIDTALEQNCCVDESIFLSNTAMIAQAQVVVADVSPFRSLEPDVGTAMQIGMATAQGKSVYLYSNQAQTSLQDAYQAQMDAQGYVNFNGHPTQVENFGHPINLMLMYDSDGTLRPVFNSLQDALVGILSNTKAQAKE